MSAISSEFCEVCSIATDIRKALAFPVSFIRLRNNTSIFAGVHVEKATMDIYDFTMSREHEVRLSSKLLLVKAESISQAVNN